MRLYQFLRERCKCETRGLVRSYLEKEEKMDTKVDKNTKTYGVKCSRCNKIMFPRLGIRRKELKKLALFEDLLKDWVEGKINIFSSIPKNTREFVERSLYAYLEEYIHDLIMRDTVQCDCSICGHEVIKCNTGGR